MGRSDNDYSLPLCLPFNDGVIVAANAIPDSALVLDSPDCALQKIENLFGNHDWLSDLCRISKERFFTPALQLPEIAMGDTGGLMESIRQATARTDISLLLLAAASVVSITDRNYSQIISRLELDKRLPVCDLTSGDLHRDWLDGYAETLIKLAENLPLPDQNAEKDENSVALVGYFMDRNEGDHTGNLDEIRRLLEALGLKTVSIWLSGKPLADLKQIRRAGSIISLPYGRRAAEILAARCGVRLIRAPLPLGIDGTASFLRIIAAATGRSDRAEMLIRSEESRTLPQLRMVLPRWFMDKNFVLVTDPYLAAALTDTLEFFGCNAQGIFINAKSGHLERDLAAEYGVEVFEEPTPRQAKDKIAQLMSESLIDFVIGNTMRVASRTGGMAIIEFGFPSHFTHYLTPAPYMGYNGVLGLVERIANRMAHDEQHGKISSE